MAEELRELGFEVVLFSTGDGLLDRVCVEKPALLLANVYLSGMLGVEVCEKIKGDESIPTRVLLIGAIFRADRYRARPTSLYGADGYFEEGLSAEAFRGIVLRALEEAGEPNLSGGEKNQR